MSEFISFQLVYFNTIKKKNLKNQIVTIDSSILVDKKTYTLTRIVRTDYHKNSFYLLMSYTSTLLFIYNILKLNLLKSQVIIFFTNVKTLLVYSSMFIFYYLNISNDISNLIFLYCLHIKYGWGYNKINFRVNIPIYVNIIKAWFFLSH